MALGTFKLGAEDTSISPQLQGPGGRIPLDVEGERVSLSLELSQGWWDASVAF